MGTDQHVIDNEGSIEKVDENGYGHGWKYLPTEPLIEILEYLTYTDLGRCCQVCRRWNEIANLSYIWKRRFKTDFSLDPEVGLHDAASSWKGEYQRVTDLVPSVEFERISEHTDEVLHVAFSNNGMSFCTCSKDAMIKVFSADWPFDTIFSDDLSKPPFRWVYTQYSQFSKSDTQLLVSGRIQGTHQAGDIVIYNIFIDQFTLQARIRIMPYDVMGTWVNESHILTSRAHHLSARRMCLCEILLNKSSQEIENLMHSTVTRSWMIACDNNNAVSYLQVVDMTKVIAQVHRSITLGCYRGKLHDMHIQAFAEHREAMMQKLKPLNDDSTHNSSCISVPAETVSSISIQVAKSTEEDHPTDWAHDNNKNKFDDFAEYSDCQSTISPPFSPAVKRSLMEGENDTDSSNPFSGPASPQLTDDELDRDDSESAEVTTGDEMAAYLAPPPSYKLLLCFTGNDVDVPHQIGIKRITQEECNDVVRHEIDAERLQNRTAGSMANIYERQEIRSDPWDNLIDVGGQLVGMTCSPCGRYLYANVRKWRRDIIPGDTRAPEISHKVSLTVIDLISMEEVKTFLGHKAESKVFFLHVSSNKHYVTSGSEDNQGYLWDRHYGIQLSTFRHEDVVNCVALNPRDPSMAVSVGDDSLIKIWRSRSFHRLLSGARAKARMRQFNT